MTSIAEREAQGSICVLDAVCLSDRAKSVLTFAKMRGLEKGTILCPDGVEHSIVTYAVQLYANADIIGGESEEMQESYQIVSLLMAMEAIREDCWSYGSKLLYDLRVAGIKLRRNEVAAFLAQDGDWETNGRDKGANMDGNTLATAMYCAHLATICNSLIGKNCLVKTEPDQGIRDAVNACMANETPQACIEALLRTFGSAYVGEQNQNRVETFIQWLSGTDFYLAPASNKYHSSYPGGLVKHTVFVVLRYIELEKPNTPAEVGKIVIAAICHDLCKLNFYKYTWRNVKVYCEDGDKWDPDGKRFRWESQLSYEIKDGMPFGHGRKSLYMAVGLLGDALTEEVAAAIDGHMYDKKANPKVEEQFMEYPMALMLHMADNLASHLDEGPQGSIVPA